MSVSMWKVFRVLEMRSYSSQYCGSSTMSDPVDRGNGGLALPERWYAGHIGLAAAGPDRPIARQMKSITLAALLTGACTLAQGEPVARLTLTTETSAPYSMRDRERVVGISTDTVRGLLDRAGIAYGIELLPWKRAYLSALERSDGCVYATARTPERERQFKWIGPIGEAEWVLMARAGRGLALRNLEDARRYRIGTYNGDVRDQYLRTHGFNVDPVQDDLTNPRKLLLDRIDLWAAGVRRGSQLLDRLGYAGKIEPVLVFNRLRLYMACNRAVPDALVTRMNAALGAMERDGTVRAIVKRYDAWEQ
jgi:polar amino acid transport system substrate-binding protein